MKRELKCNEATKRLAEILKMQTEFEAVRFTDTRKAMNIKLLLKQKIDHMLIEIKPTFTINDKEFPISKLKVGGMTKIKLINKFKDSNILMNDDIREWFNDKNFPVSLTPEIVETVFIKPSDLGFTNKVPYFELYAKAKELGLTICSDEVAVYQRLNGENPENKSIVIAMHQFVRSGSGGPWIFYFGRNNQQLGCWYGHPSDKVDSNTTFMFQIKKEVDNE